MYFAWVCRESLKENGVDGVRHAGAILALLVMRLRQRWPKVQIIFRGDSGFCRGHILAWCDRHGVDYIVGIARNARLNALSQADQDTAATTCAVRGRTVRRFTGFPYAVASWDRPHRVIAKTKHTCRGANPRYVTPCRSHRSGQS